jgi:hypothetical protein
MSKNEEQFYGMFRDAFEGYSPEVPAHIYDNVRAGMVRTGVAWKKWTALALLLVGTGAITWTLWPQSSVEGHVLKSTDVATLVRKSNAPEFTSDSNNNAATQNAAAVVFEPNLSAQNSTAKQSSTPRQRPAVTPELSSSTDAGEVGALTVAEPQVITPQVENQPVSAKEVQPEIAVEEKTAVKTVWPIKVKKTVTIEE